MPSWTRASAVSTTRSSTSGTTLFDDVLADVVVGAQVRLQEVATGHDANQDASVVDDRKALDALNGHGHHWPLLVLAFHD
jgi:hypothetical protein